ncbi:hypothetical protein [Oceanimonas smirnovii]|uniref:hypothetical protein n=1 Tax=Oceanimonas smirnovii TaxID=264574 RepID=UPI003FD1B689
MTKQLVVVLGMHRSGTSALTRSLQVLGVDLGDNLLPANAQVNAKGFWEDREILQFNVELMSVLGLDWDNLAIISPELCNSEQVRVYVPGAVALLKKKMQHTACFGLKDPRMSVLLPFWKQVFDLLGLDVFYIIAARHPLSIVQSLAKRDNMLPEQTLPLWQNYMLSCLWYTRGERCLVVEYENILKAPEQQLLRLSALTGLTFDAKSDAFKLYASDFISPELSHSHFAAEQFEAAGAVTAEHVKLYHLLVALAHDEFDINNEGCQKKIKRLVDARNKKSDLLYLAGLQSRWLNEKKIELSSALQEKEILSDHISALDKQIVELKDYVNELEPLKLKVEQVVSHHKLAEQELNERFVTINDLESEVENLSLQLTYLTDREVCLNNQLNSKGELIIELSYELQEARREVERLVVEKSWLADFSDSILNSRSWKLTRPLRKMGELARNDKSAFVKRNLSRALALLDASLRNPRLITKAFHYYKAHGVKGTVERLKHFSHCSQSVMSHATCGESEQKYIILTTPHCHYLALLISDALSKAGKDSEIIFEEPAGGFNEQLHFVICAQMFERLPPLYVAWQMEQSVSSRWFTDAYLSALENAWCVFDYSLKNIEFLQAEKGLEYKQLYYLPVGYRKQHQLVKKNEQVDVLFYGDVNNERRRCYIEKLKEHFTVEVVSNVFGDALYEKMAKAKVIVNIHYYEGALLETTRIYECLSQQQIVVSEEGSDMDEHADLLSRVDFVPVNDIDAMISRVAFWVNNSSAERAQRRKEIVADCELKPDWFEFYFMRMLLAAEIIDFEEFYEVASKHIHFQGDFVCLGLPETVSRKKDFDKDNIFNIEYFPGLRHRLGWVGCGLSYKFLMRKARDAGLPHITVCEDDVQFDPDFWNRYQQVMEHLDTRKDWDLFAGLIAQLHKELQILDVTQEGGERFITIDSMVSMVMNVYSSRFYEKLQNWDHHNHNADENTIDRFIEQHDGVRAVTTARFLAGHKEELDSTLWGFNNKTYSQMIAESETQLGELVADFEQTTTPVRAV